MFDYTCKITNFLNGPKIWPPQSIMRPGRSNKSSSPENFVPAAATLRHGRAVTIIPIHGPEFTDHIARYFGLGSGASVAQLIHPIPKIPGKLTLYDYHKFP